MKRRNFLRAAAFAPLVATSASLVQSCHSETITPSFKGKRLIILRLDGGNDALFTLAPSKNDLLQKLRPTLYKNTLNNGIQYSDWILNRHWKIMHDLMMQGDARLVPNVGYPENVWSGSHFVSADIWETGLLPGESSEKTGWIGRLLDNNSFDTETVYWPVLKLDEGQRMFDRGQNKTGISWFGNEMYKVIQPYAQSYYESNSKQDEGYKTYLLHQRLAKIELNTKYGNSPLGRQFAYTEAIIREEIPVKVIHIAQAGYDTHVNTMGILPNLYEDLLKNLKQLVSSLKSSGLWTDTQIFIYSEFGRTLDENADGGTDHGTAGHVFTLGGIDLFNSPHFTHNPTCDILELSHINYLKHQIDFRDILNKYETSWLTLNST